ncbi:MAG: mannose-1-phosphate guanylyltransferase/mannose-6-phosphate isomerase [Nitrospirae bacterium]|nr:mannose-1-phosphate guanylyltransferase/mannose-6-phosphate isomerase [Nitrospirota bacterium]MBI3378805.1 mannose-1-phosphate guanylyltransferase/mannose-6-phosphate isomerase [Nitrospirota bacterium]
MKALILAGGSGTRLWPLSRKNYPKQFLKLNGDRSLLQQTVERLLRTLPAEDIIVMTNNEYKFHVLSDLNALSLPIPLPASNIILEPVSRNTAPAIALGIKYCMEKLGCHKDEVIFISPSDHIIKPLERFVEYIGTAEKIARQGYIVTFGIKPERPETGYGYIKAGKSIGMGGYKAEEFTEKPNSETAKRYLEEGNYFWNSGMFSFSIGTMLREFSKHTPAIKEMLNGSFDDMIVNFSEMPDISIDYAIAEKSEKVAILPMDIYWNDIGSWDSLYEILDKDEMGNVKKGDVIAIDTKKSLIIGNKRHISIIGLDNCLVVETDDAILISRKGEAQKVRDVVNRLKKENRKEADEHVTTYRPWGNYTVLEEGTGYKIKRIVVNPGEKLSLQMHNRRSEHWVVIKGTAKVTTGDAQMIIYENESVYVPKSTLHRLENPAEMPLEIIEVQNGEYVGEDDIVRYDDIYGR